MESGFPSSNPNSGSGGSGSAAATVTGPSLLLASFDATGCLRRLHPLHPKHVDGVWAVSSVAELILEPDSSDCFLTTSDVHGPSDEAPNEISAEADEAPEASEVAPAPYINGRRAL